MVLLRTSLLLLAGLAGLAAGLSASDYYTGKRFHGDATYYGATEGGNCAIRNPRPAFYSKYVPVAMNAKQYAGMCGACLEITGKGVGQGGTPVVGTFKAYAMDQCPECAYGDVDISRSGDGRWDVSWKVIPCEGDSRIQFQFEGSNGHYLKLQPRGMKSPATSLKVNGVPARKTQDNHWIAQNGPFKTPFHVEVRTVLGEVSNSFLTSWHGVVWGGRLGGGGKVPHKPRPRPPKRPHKPRPRPPKRPYKPRPRPRRCVPQWKACSGPRNFWGGRCCGRFRCVWPKNPAFGAKRCEPIFFKPKPRPRPRRCVPKWRACSGPRNYWGGRCCGRYRCVWPKNKRYGSKRCEPRPRRRRRGRRGCRAKWARCGTFAKWTRWNGRPMWGRKCCPRGYVCKWSANRAFVGFRCEPWRESFREWWK